jgi:hypothetical protein
MTQPARDEGTDCPLCKLYHTPNAETIAAIEDTELFGPFGTSDELLADLNKDGD